MIDSHASVPQPPPAILRAENGSYAIGGREIYSRLNLTLHQGQVTCLLGPSGVGKSSLLRVLAGLRQEATWSKLDYAGHPTGAGAVIYMDQRDALLPWLSVLDNVLIGTRLRGRSRASHNTQRRRAMALLDQVGLADRAHDLPDTLSGGMRQRAALVRVLLQPRPFVLMDEPFAAVDALTRLSLQTLTVQLLKDRAVLIVTHDPLEAIRIGHHVYVMQGQPARLGSPLTPAGVPPRDPQDAANHQLVSDLYGQLQSARDNIQPAGGASP